MEDAALGELNIGILKELAKSPEATSNTSDDCLTVLQNYTHCSRAMRLAAGAAKTVAIKCGAPEHEILKSSILELRAAVLKFESEFNDPNRLQFLGGAPSIHHSMDCSGYLAHSGGKFLICIPSDALRWGGEFGRQFTSRPDDVPRLVVGLNDYVNNVGGPPIVCCDRCGGDRQRLTLTGGILTIGDGEDEVEWRVYLLPHDAIGLARELDSYLCKARSAR